MLVQPGDDAEETLLECCCRAAAGLRHIGAAPLQPRWACVHVDTRASATCDLLGSAASAARALLCCSWPRAKAALPWRAGPHACDRRSIAPSRSSRGTSRTTKPATWSRAAGRTQTPRGPRHHHGAAAAVHMHGLRTAKHTHTTSSCGALEALSAHPACCGHVGPDACGNRATSQQRACVAFGSLCSPLRTATNKMPRARPRNTPSCAGQQRP